MKAIAVFPGKPDSVHLAELDRPSVNDIQNGRGVVVRVLRVGVDGTDKEITRHLAFLNQDTPDRGEGGNESPTCHSSGDCVKLAVTSRSSLRSRDNPDSRMAQA